MEEMIGREKREKGRVGIIDKKGEWKEGMILQIKELYTDLFYR